MFLKHFLNLFFRNKHEKIQGNGGKSSNKNNGTKSSGKSSSKSGNTLTVGPRRERSSSLATIYTRPRR